MESIDIRVANLGDADTLVDQWVSLAAGQREHGSHIFAEANRTRIRETVVRHVVSDRALVAETTDIVGFVMFTIESGTYEQDVERGIVENLYVDSDYRNRGLGSRLLTEAERRLAQRGVDSISLEVMADNEHARRFYRNHGYTPHRVQVEKPVESDTHSKGDE